MTTPPPSYPHHAGPDAAGHPDAVRVALPAAIVISAWLVSRTWLKISREKIRHDRHKAAVTIAFTQNKLNVNKLKDWRPFIYDLNSLLHPFMHVLFFRSIVRNIKKSGHLAKQFFKIFHALFKLLYSLFHGSSSHRVVGATMMDEASRASNSPAGTDEAGRCANASARTSSAGA